MGNEGYMLSVIIPTRNEEKYIGRLLESLKRQNFNDLEIIVADADSSDRTREIAEKYGATVTLGGPHPGIGRNKGAGMARGKNLLFLDADVVLPGGYLRENYSEFLRRELDIATTFIKPISNNKIDRMIYYVINKGYKWYEKRSPAAEGHHIFVKREFFNKVNGFDEDIIMNEDLDFVQKVWKNGGKFGLLYGRPISVSVRRLKKEGRVKFVLRGIYGILYYKINGPMRRGSKFAVNYKFEGYDGIEDSDF